MKEETNRLFSAVFANSPSNVVDALEKGASADAGDGWSLSFAAGEGFDRIVDILLSPEHGMKDENKKDALLSSAKSGNWDLFAKIAKSGGDIGKVASSVVELAAGDGQAAVLRTMVPYVAGTSVMQEALLKAIDSESLECVEALVKGGADVSLPSAKDARVPLVEAARMGNPPLLMFVLRGKVSQEALDRAFDALPEDGEHLVALLERKRKDAVRVEAVSQEKSSSESEHSSLMSLICSDGRVVPSVL